MRISTPRLYMPILSREEIDAFLELAKTMDSYPSQERLIRRLERAIEERDSMELRETKRLSRSPLETPHELRGLLE